MDPGKISEGGGILVFVFTKIRNNEEGSRLVQGGPCHFISESVSI